MVRSGATWSFGIRTAVASQRGLSRAQARQVRVRQGYNYLTALALSVTASRTVADSAELR